MYALADCNNFYCSCEKVFNPKLEGKPIVVLSNNDGCAIARSEEAKALGIVMGTPEFMIRETLKEHDIKVFSSNYTLYGDLSDRVMRTFASFVPQLEIYSIDEAFLDMHDLKFTDLYALGVQIRNTVKQHIGIPTTVGIAPTKTLAKMANKYAKKNCKKTGVYYAQNAGDIQKMLAFTAVEDVWGIGAARARLFNRNGYYTAADLINAPEDWVRNEMSVTGLRLLKELKGIPAIEWEFIAPAKKNICTSRSFGKLITDKLVVEEAVCEYTATCAKKLRDQKSCARKINVFLQTNPHRKEDRQYMRSITLDLEVATNVTSELIKYAKKAFKIIYQGGYNFMKCGVMVLDIVPQDQIQFSLFNTENNSKQKTIMHTLDKVNTAFGKNLIRLASQGYKKEYKLRAAYLSKKYTTKFEDIITIKN